MELGKSPFRSPSERINSSRHAAGLWTTASYLHISRGGVEFEFHSLHKCIKTTRKSMSHLFPLHLHPFFNTWYLPIHIRLEAHPPIIYSLSQERYITFYTNWSPPAVNCIRSPLHTYDLTFLNDFPVKVLRIVSKVGRPDKTHVEDSLSSCLTMQLGWMLILLTKFLGEILCYVQRLEISFA